MTKTRQPETESERMLVDLEAQIIRGQDALQQRNALVRRMVAEGARQADVARLINHARVEAGAQPVTPDAVFAAIRRGR